MRASRQRNRKRRVLGLLPAMARGLLAASWWTLRHPQPLILVGLLSLAGWGLWGVALNTDAFRITRVLLPSESPLTLRNPLIGDNLWSVNLRAVAEELHRQQPSLKAVRVIRQLPDTIRIDPVARLPVAQVKLDRWYEVDREGFVLPEPKAQPQERLIQLTGCDRGGGLKPGRENPDERLQLGLRVWEILRRTRPMIARRVTEINVAYPEEIRFIMDGDTEVRCGSEQEFTANLERLQGTLRALAKQSLPVQYIDLRFQEPVVGPRT